ncbi:S1C family serine protease [Humibacter ginsengiterrae]
MHRIDLNGTKIMRNDSNKRRTAGWITAAVAASVAFGLAGVTASVATVDSVAAAFTKTAIAHNSERAGWSYGGGQGSTGSSSSSGQTATASEEKGVAVIDTDLAYEGAEAAGTGIVLTSSGEILTNNHVVEGSTSITVTIPATGTSYKASVVGTDATDDVAVLQLSGASGLATATLDDDGGVSVGDNVTAVGNAGGTGTLVAAPGAVTGTGKSVTTQAEGVVASESLTGMIETNADIQAGDSGGPLYDSQGEVVGIDTAASANQNVSDGYAIPIETALGIAHQIESGQASSTVTIGLPAFLGVEVASDASSDYSGFGGAGLGSSELGYSGGQSATQGAVVGGVINGTPAASAGLTAGDTITAVDGTAITSSSGLTAALAQHKPGDSVTITWVDSAGSHSANVTLTSGPAA